jgi:excisionase family DNA binding protein
MHCNTTYKRNCLYCGKEYEAKTLYTRYCSHPCNSKHYKKLKKEEKIKEVEEKLYNPKPESSQAEPKAFDITLQQKEFLSIDDTAQLLGTSRRTIHRLISKGQLKVAKIGARSILKRQEIDKLFK